MTTPEATPTAPAAPVQGTEVPAPTAPAAPAPESLEVKPAAPAAPVVEAVEAVKTGDPALDIALGFFASQGVKPESAAMVLASKGDFSVLKAELAAKGAKGWEQYAAIAEQAHTRSVESAKAATQATLGIITNVMGSQETWAQVKTFIGEKADAGELAQINAALKQGGLVAKATAEYMKRVYEAGQGKPTPTPAATDIVSLNNRGAAPATTGALSPKEYVAAVQELSRTIGANRLDSSKEYAALRARRQAYRG